MPLHDRSLQGFLSQSHVCICDHSMRQLLTYSMVIIFFSKIYAHVTFKKRKRNCNKIPLENHPEKTAPAGIDLHIGWQISCHSTIRLLHEISNYLLNPTAKNYRVARFKDILMIRDNILITCYTIKIFGVAKKPRGLYCRTKLKTIEWQIHHISTYEVRFAIIQLIAKIIATGHNEVLLYIK